MGPVAVELVVDEELKPGRFTVVGDAAPGRRRRPGADRSCCRRASASRSATGTVTVGRLPDCTIPLNDQNVSRRHAEIRPGRQRLRRGRPRIDERHQGQRHAHPRRAACSATATSSASARRTSASRRRSASGRSRHPHPPCDRPGPRHPQAGPAGLLYLFFARVLWAVWSEVRTADQPRRLPQPHRPTDDSAADGRRPAPAPKAPKRRRRAARGRRRPAGDPRAQGAPRRHVRRSATRSRSGATPAARSRSTDDTFVSQLHARVYLVDGQPMVEDLGSTNGTYLNGNRLNGARLLHPGDRLQVGNTVLEAQ